MKDTQARKMASKNALNKWAATRIYNSGSLVLIGDSRLAQMYATYGTTNKTRNGFNFLTQGFAQAGQRVTVEAMLATSGQRSDQYLAPAQQQAAFATRALWAIVYGIVNDVAATGNTIDYWTVTIKPFVQAWIAAGRKVILITEAGANTLTTAAQRGAVFKYNQQIREFCRTTPNAVLFDMASLVLTPGQAMTLNSNYSGDGTHINLMAGGNAAGVAFGALLNQLFPPCDGLVKSAGEVYSNGAVQWFPNPLWTTTTGGVATGTNETWNGNVPAGITATATTAGATSITATNAAGTYGNALQLAITTAQAGVVRVQYDLSLIGVENPGDVFYSSAKLGVAAGASNFQWCSTYLESNRAGVTRQVEDGYAVGSAVNGALPSGAYSWVSETERLVIDSGARGWLTGSLRAYFAGAGSATLIVERLGVFRVQP
ncbi:GDSL-type esterase/lipase family protein [Novosphingobium sp. NBM11]|uniref:GDSL-type esterase/lipase family protein n=1 Tax=Novosphingobium sp. NBM11 TaxID=2596914 RepID=UPI0019D653B2|nr:GDSL-type esterase/lipase family protein [Novosphingobium sp. NBM11]